MKGKTHVHIISHTHWDREWYLPYEKHHVLLVKLMDNLLETLDNDPDFKSYHLDGQTIIIDDYLQVRPDQREKLQQYIEAGRIHIGPWYILQDEFLTSSESNIRNLQYGMKDAKKWGNLSKVGYFPDSFGNMGQAPQILKQAGINNAVFGRGVKPTGFNNLVTEANSYESPFSEMTWRSPDGSEVVGILMANWYCNGNEIPVEKEAAREYWDRSIKNMETYASSSHMLLMNGCDHQPVQKDLSEAIETARELYPDVEFVHSNFNDYVASLIDDLPENLKVVDGELRSQHTDGWGTLVNTASSRLYLKQWNQEVQTLLEKVAEPLSTFNYLQGGDYNHHLLEYAWKTLMQNHPHDSICGCSVDEVHREMVTRFEKAKHVAEMIVDESLETMTENIDTTGFKQYGEDALPFTVYNTSGTERTNVVSIVLDVKREYFSEGVNKKGLKELPIDGRVLVDDQGNAYDCNVEDLGIAFDYDLPDDKFRQPYMVRRVKLTFEATNVPSLGYKTFAWVKNEEAKIEQSTLIPATNEMENEYIHVKINQNGSFTVTNKANGHTFDQLGIYEDTGDIGNEYIYKQPNGEEALTTKDLQAKIEVVEDHPFRATYKVVHEWELPKGGDDVLTQEQIEVVFFKSRKAQRVKETVPFTIETLVTLEKSGKGIDVDVSFDNQAKDHRLRALFPTELEADVHHADSIFEVAKRNNQPSAEWENPDNSQHQHVFVGLSNDQAGLTVANKGLNEYEVLRDGKNTIALTLLRSTGEMGDWGHFPTPEAQCLGEHKASYRLIPHQGEKERTASYQDAYQYQIPWTTQQTGVHAGELAPTKSVVAFEAPKQIAYSSLKVSEQTEDVMIRWYNTTNEAIDVSLQLPTNYKEAYWSNVIEEQVETLNAQDNKVNISINNSEIATVGLKNN